VERILTNDLLILKSNCELNLSTPHYSPILSCRLSINKVDIDKRSLTVTDKGREGTSLLTLMWRPQRLRNEDFRLRRSSIFGSDRGQGQGQGHFPPQQTQHEKL